MNQKNESPFASPRFIVIMGITFLILWGWQHYLNNKYPPTAATVATDAGNKSLVTTYKADAERVAAPQAKKTEAEEIKAEYFTYNNDVVEFTVSNLGFGFSDFKVKTYKNAEGQPLAFAFPEMKYFALSYKGNLIPFKIKVSEDKQTFTGVADIQGKTITRVLAYDHDKRAFNSTIQFSEPIDEIDILVQEKKLISNRNSVFLPSFDHQDFIYVSEGKTHSDRISATKEGEVFSKTAENVTIASVGTQYFVSSILNKSDINPHLHNTLEKDIATVNLKYQMANSKLYQLNQVFYMGPKKTEILNGIDASMSDLLNYGIFGFISKILLYMLKEIHGFVGNWGVAIIILTLIVRTAMMPLNVASFRSAQSMQKIKPQMDAIRAKYKSDPMRMNQETMALMKQNKANPLSGCLPMLVQIPIFFAFFGMISTSVELYQQPFFGWIHDLSAHDPFFIFPILMGITMFFQQKLTPTTMDPTQAKILAFMPIIFTLFMLTLPSGLTLYNFVSALFGVAQQYYMLKHKKV